MADLAKRGRAALTFLRGLLTPEGADRSVRHAGRVLLGAFVLWQVFFLVASFFVRVEEVLRKAAAERWPVLEAQWPRYARGEDDFHENLSRLQSKWLKRYGEATGQPQAWRLFAPDVARTFCFPEVELRWDDDHDPGPAEAHPREPVLLPALNGPDDINSFLRYKDFRIRKYESSCTPAPARQDLAFDPHGEFWANRIESEVRENGENMVAYLRWRWREYQREHPGEDRPPPTQVILHMRGYAIPPPPGPQPWRYIDYGRHPVARWLPWGYDQSGAHALERYDPLTDRYR